MNFLIALLFVGATPLALAGGKVGNTAGAIYCDTPTAEGQPEKNLWLEDYLFTQKEVFSKTVSEPSTRQYFYHITNMLKEIDPKIGDSFLEFRRLFLSPERSKKYVWIEANRRLTPADSGVEFNDDDDIPEEAQRAFETLHKNCKKNGKPDKVYVIIKVASRISGRNEDEPLFKYDGPAMDDLAANSPLQVSMAAVHEWLWFYTKNLRVNWLVNRYLHSELMASEFKDNQHNAVLNRLKGIGIEFTVPDEEDEQPPVESARMFVEPNLCLGHTFFNDEDINDVLFNRSRGGNYLTETIVNRNTVPAVKLSDKLKTVSRVRTCRTSSPSQCSGWFANDKMNLFVNNRLAKTDIPAKLIGHIVKLGNFTAFQLKETVPRQQGFELMCVAADETSDLEESAEKISCRPHNGQAVIPALSDRPNNPLKLSGQITRKCFHVISSPVKTGVSSNGTFEEAQMAIFGTYPARFTRVRRIIFN